MWFYHDGSQNLGPFKQFQIQELYSSGKIHDQTPVSSDGETWEPASLRLGKEAEEQMRAQKQNFGFAQFG